MSKYVHPMQEEFNKKISDILIKYKNAHLEINNIVSLLANYHIKFYSKDDLAKFTKIIHPFEPISLKIALTYLEFVYVHMHMETKHFIVKFSGRSNKVLNVKECRSKKNQFSHALQCCMSNFRKRLHNFCGEAFWFRLLGGVPGTNEIRKEALHKKISKIMANTCHSTCVDQIINYLTEGKKDEFISWDLLLYRISNKSIKNCEILLQELKRNHSALQSRKQKDRKNEGGFRITTFTASKLRCKQLQLSNKTQCTKKSTIFENQKLPIRRKLKTLHENSKGLLETSHNLQIIFNGQQSSETIHSIKKKPRYKLMSPVKKYKTGFSVYQQY